MSDLTVEEALRELGEMFPEQKVYLERNDYGSLEPERPPFTQLKVKLTVDAKPTRRGTPAPLTIKADTLDEAMAQVRERVKERE